MKNVVTSVLENSIGEEVGIEAGDILRSINGKKVKDIFDYRFLIADEYIEALVEKPNGELWELEIEKEEGEDLGLSFSEPMMDKATSCRNKCMFCFIDQLPSGMRNSLYFKDDDSRLSFLQGNYVTLTNISDKDLERIIYYHLSPINVSVHTTDPLLRIKMLGNENAGKIMSQLKRISEAGIEINCQIVLVKGVNDGKRLIESIDALMGVKGVNSISVVPVGLTRHREGLHPITPFEKCDAEEVIKALEQEQGRALSEKGTIFVYAGDEFYLKADIPLPLYESYDDFPQLENGVGMTRLFEREFEDVYGTLTGDSKHRRVSVVTGSGAYGFMKGLVERLKVKYTNAQIDVIMVRNNFFGEEVTVSGLLTGRDIIAELKKRGTAGRVLLPLNCFKTGEDVLLDDVTLEDIKGALNITAVKTPCTGRDFIAHVLNI